MWDLLAIFLIVSPATPPVASRAPEPLWQSLKKVALITEIVGPHERWATDFRSELAYCRRHYRELLDAPQLDDCTRFPTAEFASGCCRLNWAYQDSLKNRRWVHRHRWDEISEALEEAQRLYQVWEHVKESLSPDRSWACRRRALQRLKDALGPGAYYAGDLPCCLPYWRFTQID